MSSFENRTDGSSIVMQQPNNNSIKPTFTTCLFSYFPSQPQDISCVVLFRNYCTGDQVDYNRFYIPDFIMITVSF